MDSFELNKVAGAVLGTLLFAFGTGFLAELIYHPKPAGQAGYALPGGGAEGGHGGGAAPAAEAPKGDSIATRLASADAEKGKAGTKPCQGCHSFEKGGPNKMGPDLWEVVGRHKGGHEGFDYSAGLKAKGGEWTYEDLDAFLTKPGEYIKGTKMSFAGISGAQDRANVIAYLRTLADSPKPLPAASKEEGKKEDAKKDEGKGAEKGADKPADKAEGGGAGGSAFTAKVASADPKKGEAGVKVCQACHNFQEGAGPKVGPDLYGVVGRKKGSVAGFDYSPGMKAKGGEWTYDDLNAFLTKPGDYVKGTKMAFAGISAEDKRAEVVAYLRTLAANPQPLPGADKKDEAKPAEKPADKPAEKPAEAKPEEKKADKPAEAKPEETKQGDAKPADKPAEAKPEEKKAEEKPADKPAETKPETPAAPPAAEAPAKPEPSAEEKAKEQQAPEAGKDQPEQK